MAEAGAATVIADADLEPGRLLEAVAAVLTDPVRLAEMAAASAALAKPDAARRIADEILEAVRR
jgi:UDP-N-acetylglucosamine--N-acetylmuramyl-(pentapeptide) pyrophosphoryl-undecaprenol N-acetylglucosamine transferase